MTRSQTLRKLLRHGGMRFADITQCLGCTKQQAMDAIRNLQRMEHVELKDMHVWTLTDTGANAANGSDDQKASRAGGSLKLCGTSLNAGEPMLPGASTTIAGLKSGRATSGRSANGSKQRLLPRTAAALAELTTAARSLREMYALFPHQTKATTSAIVNRLRKQGYVDGGYVNGIFRYEANDKGRTRLANNDKIPPRTPKVVNDWEPNVTRRIGDLGGLRVASVWAYAQQVGA